jgi:hypothetical protein
MSWRGAGVLTERPADYEAVYLGKLLYAGGFRWLSLKIHDGVNTDPGVLHQLETGWAKRVQAQGVAVGGWGVNGVEPEAEARLVANLVRTHGLAHYMADAEAAHKADTNGDPGRSKRFVDTLRPLAGKLPLALTSYGAAAGDNLLGHTRDGGYVMDYRPWYQAGYHFLPQAYPNEFGDVYELEACLRHARRAGWPLSRIHLMIGNYGGWHAEHYRARLRKVYVEGRTSSKRPTLCGFNVFLLEQMREEDVEEYGRMIRRWWLADT